MHQLSFSLAQQEQEECAVSARYSDESIRSVTPRFEENLGNAFRLPRTALSDVSDPDSVVDILQAWSHHYDERPASFVEIG
jgi:hypothetical protein